MEFKETDIKRIVKEELKNLFNDLLDKEVGKILNNRNSQSRSELIKTIRDSFDVVYKTMWQKKDFWKQEIK